MRLFPLRTLIASLLLAGFSLAQGSSSPDLHANSSVARGFPGHNNGNAPEGEVSKLPVRSLLYPGATTRIYVRLMPFFVKGGGEGHVDVGYSSNERRQVGAQLEDMISRGVDGAILDWYGPRKQHHEQVAQLLRDESERRHFEFALSLDTGAVKACQAAGGGSVEDCVLSDLDYAADHYYGSPQYMRRQSRSGESRPVMFFFGLEQQKLDWQRIKQQARGNPLFVFRNSGAFAVPGSDGGFAWIGDTKEPRNGLAYLDRFYDKADSARDALVVGSAYKGFDNSLASWGKKKQTPQQCAQTWLDTFAEINHRYSQRHQLDSLQLLTWNDYEEGTELESGIDNCVRLTLTLDNGSLRWDLGGGNGHAIDHFELWATRSGNTPKLLRNLPRDKRSLRLTDLDAPLDSSYSVVIKAIGVPFVQDRASAPLTLPAAAASR